MTKRNRHETTCSLAFGLPPFFDVAGINVVGFDHDRQSTFLEPNDVPISPFRLVAWEYVGSPSYKGFPIFLCPNLGFVVVGFLFFALTDPKAGPTLRTPTWTGVICHVFV